MLDAALGQNDMQDALVGPNAILQLARPVDETLGPGTLAQVLDHCGVDAPSGTHMIAERDVAKVHRALHRLYPDEARGIARAAGFGTAQYIRRNRIPAPARLLLRIMPGPIGARLLTKAISAHAWTFCGSGSLSVRIGETISFRIENNPLLAVSHAAYPQCDWHVAVFEELFTSLLGRTYKAVETQCCAQGAPACTFEVSAV